MLPNRQICMKSGVTFGIRITVSGKFLNLCVKFIKDLFSSNTIGQLFDSNTVEDSFQGNTIGDYFNSNTTGMGFLENGNSETPFVSQNTEFRNFINNVTSSTEIQNPNIDVVVFTSPNGTLKQRYYNNSNTLVINNL